MMWIGIILTLILTCSDCLYIHHVNTFQNLVQGEKGYRAAVALTAVLSKDTTVGSQGVVKYDTVLTNVGGAYVPSTEIFTAPYKGIYTISCSLMSQPSNAVHVQITKNGTKLSVLYSASSTYPQSGQTLHLLLKKADKIWIQNITGKTAEFHDRGQYNLFSGSLVTKL
eukprot:XP_011450801.1 PREDICTED: complement C1q-like protein 4 [Crassostrea gigas]